MNNKYNKKCNRLRLQSKAQIFSLDLIFALIIFIFILLSTSWVWYVTDNKINYVRSLRDMNIVAKNTMYNIVSTRGNPVNWHLIPYQETSNIDVLGILDDRAGVANPDKIKRLINLSINYYNDTKKILGVIGAGYEYNIKIDEAVGGLPYNNSKYVVGVDRALMLPNGTLIEINLRIWK